MGPDDTPHPWPEGERCLGMSSLNLYYTAGFHSNVESILTFDHGRVYGWSSISKQLRGELDLHQQTAFPCRLANASAESLQVCFQNFEHSLILECIHLSSRDEDEYVLRTRQNHWMIETRNSMMREENKGTK